MLTHATKKGGLISLSIRRKRPPFVALGAILARRPSKTLAVGIAVCFRDRQTLRFLWFSASPAQRLTVCRPSGKAGAVGYRFWGCGSEPARGKVSGEYPLALRHLQALHTQFVYRRRLVLRMVVLCRQLAPSPLGSPRAVLTRYVTRRSRSRPVGLALSLWSYYTTFRRKSQPLFCVSPFCTKTFNAGDQFLCRSPGALECASVL